MSTAGRFACTNSISCSSTAAKRRRFSWTAARVPAAMRQLEPRTLRSDCASEMPSTRATAERVSMRREASLSSMAARPGIVTASAAEQRVSKTPAASSPKLSMCSRKRHAARRSALAAVAASADTSTVVTTSDMVSAGAASAAAASASAAAASSASSASSLVACSPVFAPSTVASPASSGLASAATTSAGLAATISLCWLAQLPSSSDAGLTMRSRGMQPMRSSTRPLPSLVPHATSPASPVPDAVSMSALSSSLLSVGSALH